MHSGVSAFARGWLDRLALGNGQRFAVAAATKVLPWFNAATPRHFAALGAGAFGYASVFLAEGIGLWQGNKWAEYLTIGVTASLLPFEIAAVYNKLTVVRVLTLVVNSLVIAYLVWELRARNRLEARGRRWADAVMRDARVPDARPSVPTTLFARRSPIDPSARRAYPPRTSARAPTSRVRRDRSARRRARRLPPPHYGRRPLP